MRATVVLLLLAGLSSGIARAQASPATAQQRQALVDYPLTRPRAYQLISAMEAMTRHIMSLPDAQARVAASMKMTPEQQRAQMEKDPRAMAILKENRLTPDEYLVGVPALRMALMAAQGLNAPNVIVSPANLAFAKANLAELKPKMDVADGVRK